ncbi:MAG: preprotein translocase subunit SecE [Alphaproteobacteria bacterium]|nr:preprotein translocase subunit SecE [Alphaproteobacteria bacterium]
MAKISPLEFMRQVRQEVSKVTWPTRKETIITSIMVFLMVFICAVFFLIVDRLLAWGVSFILGMGA